MAILVTSRYEEDLINIEGAGVATTQMNFQTRAANSTVRGRIWLKFEPIRDIIVVLVTCKNEEDPMNNKGASVATTFFSLLVYGDFSRRSRAANSAI